MRYPKAAITTLAALSALTISACAMADSLPTETTKTSLGKVLTDSEGMTLYTFAKDSWGEKAKSNCNGECAVKWPPLTASTKATSSEKYTVITRDDGSKQWAHNGQPLYTWFKDQKPGDTTGNGIKGVWEVARP